jgi:hypothetical protein
MMHNVSFKREPDASFQEIDIRETDKNRLQQSQSSQGRSLSGSQAQQARGEIGAFTSSVYVGPKAGQAGSESKPQTAEQLKPIVESKLSQSGVRSVQTPQASSFENVSLVKSGIYTTQAANYPSSTPAFESAVYQSQQSQQSQQGQRREGQKG